MIIADREHIDTLKDFLTQYKKLTEMMGELIISLSERTDPIAKEIPMMEDIQKYMKSLTYYARKFDSLIVK